MKQMLLFLTLMALFQINTPSQEGKFEKIALDPSTKPIIVGFKRFSERTLNNLDPEKRVILHKISNRSCVESCLGLDSHTITPQERDNIESFSGDIKGKMNFEVIPIQGSCCINGRDVDSMCNCVPRFNRANGAMLCMIGAPVGLLTALGSGLAALITNNCIWLALWGPAAAMPACGCVGGECATCVYYRCCADREVWNFDNPKK